MLNPLNQLGIPRLALKDPFGGREGGDVGYRRATEGLSQWR